MKSFYFLFRLNGSHQIGLGHVFRCRELANQLKKEGKESVFIVNTDSVVESLLGDFETIQLPQQYNAEEELSLIKKTVQDFNVVSIVSDLLGNHLHYRFNPELKNPHFYCVGDSEFPWKELLNKD